MVVLSSEIDKMEFAIFFRFFAQIFEFLNDDNVAK